MRILNDDSDERLQLLQVYKLTKANRDEEDSGETQRELMYEV